MTSAAKVTGTVGMIFNDFLDDFLVEDVEGETFKEVMQYINHTFIAITFISVCNI